MKLDQRREELRGELTRLMSIIVEYRLSCPPALAENEFIHELESQLQRKTEEMEQLNALSKSPRFRFQETCYDLKLVIWVSAISMCFAALFLGSELGGGYAVGSAICAVLSLIWAIWSSYKPDF